MRLLWEFVRVSVMGELAYRVNFSVRLFQSLLELATALAGLAIIFSYTDTLGGWRPEEIAALLQLGERATVAQAAAFGLMLTAGAAIVYTFWRMLATLSFWFVRVENILVIFQSMYQAGRWPISLYPGWLRFGLTFIVPVAFATTVPAEAVTGRLDAATLVGALILAAMLRFAARRVWHIGLRHYSGASA